MEKTDLGHGSDAAWQALDALVRTSSFRNALLSVLAIAGAGACSENASRRLPASYPFASGAVVSEFSDVFEVVDSLVLEENDGALVSFPIVNFDGEHFLMADMYAQQVRVYTRTGELVSSEGSRGDGPGQFLAPVSARPTRNGGILVTDALAVRSTYYGSDALRDPEVAMLPTLFPVDQVDLGYGQTLVVGPSATTSSGDRQMLHVWNRNPDSSKTVASFFPDPSPEHLAEDAEFFGDVDAEIARDTIWAVVALSDSVYAMDMDGARIRAIPLPLLYQTGPYEVLWRIMNLNFLDNGDLAVQLITTTGQLLEDNTYHLAIVDRHGEPTALLRDTPRLHVVADDLFYFQHPNRLEPNQWIAARRRNSS